MIKKNRNILELIDKRKGIAQVEYLLIISLTTIVAITVLIIMSGQLKGVFNSIEDKLQPVNEVLRQ